MNQDFNNLNNQNNNLMPSNQPVQSNNISMMPNPPKKKNIGIIIGIAAVVVAVIIGCVLIFDGDSKSQKNSNKDKENSSKTITYFNSSTVNTQDKISFNLESQYGSEKGIFFGISGQGVAKNLKSDSSSLINDTLTLNKYVKSDELSIYYNNQYYIFELDSQSYLKDDMGEYFDNQLITYKDGKYFVTENNIDSYTLYYLYDENYYDGFHDGKTHGYWYAINISFPKTLEDAKKRINEIVSNIEICIYDKKEGYDNCLTNDGKLFDYKKYKYIDDVLIDSLIDYNLYVDSYQNITKVQSGDIYVEKYIALEGTDENDLTKFEIEFENGTINQEKIITTSSLNNQEVQFRKPTSLYYACLQQEKGYVEILIDLPYGAEENDENAIKVLKETFSKTK